MKKLSSSIIIVFYVLALYFVSQDTFSEETKKSESGNLKVIKYKPLKRSSYWTLNNEFQVSTNPLGLQDNFQLKNKIRLYNSEDMLFKDSYISFGVIDYLSPAYNYIGAQMEIEPIAFFDIKFRGFFVGYTSFYGCVRLPDYNVDYSDASLEKIKATTEIGWNLQITPTLKMQIGPIIFADSLNLYYFKQYFSDYFYEPYADILLFNEDWAMQNNLILGYEIKFKEGKKDALVIGILHQYALVFNSKTYYHKIGPFLSWTISDQWAGMLNPTLFGTVDYYIDHPSRKGTFYVAITYSFDYDL